MTEKRSGWGVNPPELYAGIEPSGPASAYSQLGKKAEKQIPTEIVVKDLVDLLKAMPLSEDQVEELYLAIAGRAIHKVCSKCHKMQIIFGGKWTIHPSLDLSKPKSFTCRGCL
jgi:hypothetical protein